MTEAVASEKSRVREHRKIQRNGWNGPAHGSVGWGRPKLSERHRTEIGKEGGMIGMYDGRERVNLAFVSY